MNKIVPMRVPAEFRKLIREKAGQQDISMFEYLKRISDKKVSRGERFEFKW